MSTNNKIIFIERKKYVTLGQRVKNFYQEFLCNLVESNYKEEKLLWRVVYDKIYRPELYNFVNTVKDSKEVNVVRNIFTLNETKYPYKLLKDSADLGINDDEIYTENNYLQKLHKYYKMENYAYRASLPLILITSYHGVVNRKKPKFSVSCFFLAIALGVTFYGNNQKTAVHKSELEKILQSRNENEVQVYRRFFYDD